MRKPTEPELRVALEESVKLQSHYADLLNMYDGGKRMEFKGVDEWMARLMEIGTLPKEAPNHPAQWRDVSKLVDQWRNDADSINRDAKARGYTSGPYQDKAGVYRNCAEQLAALLPPEKEPKS